MDPGNILRRGQVHASEGRHKEALCDYLWFHKHALEHNRAYYGVRLSFALLYWKQLAEAYPPAATAMTEVRNEAAAAVLTLEGDTWTLFDEVMAIDRELGRSRDTYGLFLALMAKDQERAKRCAALAIPSIVEAGDYDLATKFLPHPEHYLLLKSERLNENLERKVEPRRRALAELDAFVHIYCEDVELLLRVIEGVGEKSWRGAAMVWAIALVRPRKARSMVAKLLTNEERLRGVGA
jgi:hypothetical protein